MRKEDGVVEEAVFGEEVDGVFAAVSSRHLSR
jgi:hypothetical protein